MNSLVIMADICVTAQNGGDPKESRERRREGSSPAQNQDQDSDPKFPSEMRRVLGR